LCSFLINYAFLLFVSWVHFIIIIIIDKTFATVKLYSNYSVEHFSFYW